MMTNTEASVSSSTASVTVVPSQSQSSTSQSQPQPQQTANVVVDDVLSAILESPNFTVAEYLNTALYDVIEPKTSSNINSNSSSNNTPIDHYSSAVIHRLTELAVSLQMQTQTSHDTISRTGMELQTILPRCYNDLQRLQTSYMNVLSDCQQLHSDCCSITNHNHNNHTNTSSTSMSMNSDDAAVGGGGGGGGGGGTTVMTTNEKKLHTTSTTSTSNSSNVDTATSNNNSSNSNNSNITTTTTTATAAKAAMETLGTLHALQSNLSRTKEILIALDVWDTTINAISNYIVQENTSDAVQCLISLQQSEWTLRGMKEQADQRKFTLHKLQQQVTTVLLQPNLVHALSILPQYHPDSSSSFSSMVPSTPSLSVSNTTNTTMNNNITTTTTAATATTLIAPIQQCVQLYRQLNQLDTLTFEYIKQRPIPIQKLWFDTYQVNIPPTTAHMRINENNSSSIGNIEGGESQLEHPMIQWLPNYYQQVLHFINEERQLCEQIFHNHTTTGSTGTAPVTAAIIIPTILIQIVQECFRTNIISSFTSRLHTIYNPNNNNTTTAMSSSVSTFPIIATLYESTIQFLSLLYENIVSSYMDMIESSSSSTTTTTTTSMTSKGNDVYQLYQQICTTFMSIVLPFREYQGKQYHHIELQYVQVTIQPNIKAIQQLTKHMKSNTEMTVEVLQETMDQLQSVATKTIFTLLESTLQRYELLNGGYYIVDMIQMMDKNILHQYLNEISITVHTLSAYIVQNESSQFVKIFEEEHVSIALQTLLMMNQLIQSVHQIEHDTMIMIQRLYDRIRNYHNQEERRNRNTTTSFQLSETLSMVEVNTILTKNVAMGGDETKNDSNEATTLLSNTITTLQRWINSSSNSATTKTPLLTTVHETIQQKLLLSCHTFIFDVCYAIPRYYLSSIVSYKSWKADSSTASVNEYGTLPQEYMTHIGEHMLALVQALEPFAMNNDYLQQVNQNSNIVMNPKLIRRVVQPIWIDVVSAMGSSKNGIQGNNAALQILMNGTELIDYVLGDVVTIQHDETETNQDDDEDNDDDDNHKAVTTFCNTWLDVISTAMTGRLIERILRIPLLTHQGCEHIQADLAYIINVLTALGIPGHPHPLLTHIATLATLDETVLKERHDAMSSSYDNPETTVSMRLIQSIEQRFIAMRSFG